MFGFNSLFLGRLESATLSRNGVKAGKPSISAEGIYSVAESNLNTEIVEREPPILNMPASDCFLKITEDLQILGWISDNPKHIRYNAACQLLPLADCMTNLKCEPVSQMAENLLSDVGFLVTQNRRSLLKQKPRRYKFALLSFEFQAELAPASRGF